jgi:hypothetical protein
LMSVLLPEPDQPTKATLSPERAGKLTSARADSLGPGCR